MSSHRRRALSLPERLRAQVRTIVLDTLAVTAGVVVYFGVRGLTVGDPETAQAHAGDILQLERQLGLDVEQGVQAALNGFGILTTLANWVYIWGHWPMIVGTLIWLALRHRIVFRRLRDAMVVSGLMGLCVYTTYPVAPPRLSGIGMIDTVSEQSAAYRVLQPPAFVNQYAAMPSLHVGWDLLVGLALLAASTAWVVRLIGVAMPLAMAGATVLTANHYVLDVLVGAGFGLVGWSVAGQLGHCRDRRSAAAATSLPCRPRSRGGGGREHTTRQLPSRSTTWTGAASRRRASWRSSATPATSWSATAGCARTSGCSYPPGSSARAPSAEPPPPCTLRGRVLTRT